MPSSAMAAARTRRRVTAVALTLLIPTMIVVDPTFAQEQSLYGRAHVVCQGGAHVVTVAGNDYAGIANQIDHLVLRRETVGACEPAVVLEDSPLPFVPVDNWGDISFSATVTLVPPRLDVAYRYVPLAVRIDGTQQYLDGSCDADSRSYALTDCPNTPFLRGQLVFDYYTWPFRVRIAACASDCWTESYYASLSLEEAAQLAGLPVSALLNQYVDVFGHRTYCGMLGDSAYVLTRIALTPGGACGAVPVQRFSWGAVKAMYR